jgi:hypothetical protein
MSGFRLCQTLSHCWTRWTRWTRPEPVRPSSFHHNLHLTSIPCYYIIVIIISGTRLSPSGTAATNDLSYQPQMIDDGDFGAIGEMKFGRENRSTRREPAPEPLCPPQIPHDQTRARTRAAVVGSQRLTA